jgi:hypothetical protein
VGAVKLALGWKAHTGWAALVVVGAHDGHCVVVDRHRVALVDEDWAKQPYHVAEDLPPDEARDVIARGIDAARRGALRETEAVMARERERGHRVTACGVVVGNSMPDWTVDEIRAVHFRMPKAEGVLYRDVLMRAAEACNLRLATVPEKGSAAHPRMPEVTALGKGIGPPWGKDQREAALAALVALLEGAG